MDKQVIITNGSGTSNLINGSYSVVADVPGYDNTSISPSNITVQEGTNEYSFTISADGTLTLHVTEEGTVAGTPVVGATFVRTDSEGNEYGTPITSDSQGNAVFDNVPYETNGAPVIYFKQTASDGDHEFDAGVQSITLSTQTQTLEITNAIGATRTIHLLDANYSNLPIESGTLTLTNS